MRQGFWVRHRPRVHPVLLVLKLAVTTLQTEQFYKGLLLVLGKSGLFVACLLSSFHKPAAWGLLEGPA